MSELWDVVIVGAGIVGSACALECAGRGLRTAVVEGKGIASGATAAGMGHIVVMDDSPAQMALTCYSQTLWKGLSDRLPASVNGVPVEVPTGTTVAAAILMTGSLTRRSVTGEPRGPLCGMGICFECRVTIDGMPHQRSCQSLCVQGMEVHTS